MKYLIGRHCKVKTWVGTIEEVFANGKILVSFPSPHFEEVLSMEDVELLTPLCDPRNCVKCK